MGTECAAGYQPVVDEHLPAEARPPPTKKTRHVARESVGGPPRSTHATSPMCMSLWSEHATCELADDLALAQPRRENA